MSESNHEHHIIPLSTYFKVFGALMFLTLVTVLAAEVDLNQYLGEGPWNVILAMLIAVVKSTLVLLFFMHLYYDSRTNLFFFLGSLLFVVIFISFTYFDVAYRHKNTYVKDEAYQKFNDSMTEDSEDKKY